MTWHKVSDKAPPKENSPWLMFMASELSGSSTRARWKNGYWAVADDGLWMKDREVADYLWTLAPGQEPAEVESGAVLAAAHRAIEALGDIAAACTAEAPHDQIREMARAAIIDLGSTESVPGEEPAEAAPDGDWYCDHCEAYQSPQQVTFEETHDQCGKPVRWVEATPGEDSVEVRIAVAVDVDRRWSAYGHVNDGDEAAASVACDHLNGGAQQAIRFVPVRVPLPRPVEVRGEVEP